MKGLVLLAAVAACRIPLDSTGTTADATTAGTCQVSTAPACVAADGYQDLANIQANIFDKQCTFSGCHDGGNTAAGIINLTSGKAWAHLVNATSDLEMTRKLVVPGDPAKSYLEVMLGDIKPSEADPPAGPIRADVGLMPMNNAGQLLCCQKLGAIKRWIMAGAPQ